MGRRQRIVAAVQALQALNARLDHLAKDAVDKDGAAATAIGTITNATKAWQRQFEGIAEFLKDQGV